MKNWTKFRVISTSNEKLKQARPTGGQRPMKPKFALVVADCNHFLPKLEMTLVYYKMALPLLKIKPINRICLLWFLCKYVYGKQGICCG